MVPVIEQVLSLVCDHHIQVRIRTDALLFVGRDHSVCV
jgi:hypothetical protein